MAAEAVEAIFEDFEQDVAAMQPTLAIDMEAAVRLDADLRQRYPLLYAAGAVNAANMLQREAEFRTAVITRDTTRRNILSLLLACP